MAHVKGVKCVQISEEKILVNIEQAHVNVVTENLQNRTILCFHGFYVFLFSAYDDKRIDSSVKVGGGGSATRFQSWGKGLLLPTSSTVPASLHEGCNFPITISTANRYQHMRQN